MTPLLILLLSLRLFPPPLTSPQITPSAEKTLASRASQLEDEGWLRGFGLLRRLCFV